MNLQIDTDYGKKFEPAVVVQELGDEFNLEDEKEIGFCRTCNQPRQFYTGSRNKGFDNVPLWQCTKCKKPTETLFSIDEITRYDQLSEIEKDGWSTAATRW